jgi:methyl acetate hydrolase
VTIAFGLTGIALMGATMQARQRAVNGLQNSVNPRRVGASAGQRSHLAFARARSFQNLIEKTPRGNAMMKLTNVDNAFAQATDARQIPGVVAAAATDKEIIYQGAFGKRDLGKSEAVTLDSVFWIASMTKAITATAAMQLVEQGKLALDEPIGKVLADLASPQVFDGFDADGTPKLRPAKQGITLRHLMTHTAGFCYHIWNANMLHYLDKTGVPGITSCENKALLVPLFNEPGERWEYGINIDFVGKAVEAASGKRLDAYLKDHIFAPLGMADTGFKIGAAQRVRLVGVHARGPDGTLTPMPFEIPQDPEFHMGGGGLYGTAPDYIAFIRMLLNGGSLNGNRVLKPETVATMGRNHIGALNVTTLPTAMPPLSNDVELYPEQDKKWGLSFLINTKRTAEGRSAGSLAWAGLANTYFWLDPARKVGGVILMQLLPFADGKALELFGAFERGVYQSLDGTMAAA